MEAYEAFAYAYDQALGNRFFASVRPLVDRLFGEHHAPEGRHLDVACGTGQFLRHLRETGVDAVGIDASLAMLDVARRRTRGLVAADFRALPFRLPFARITCLYDSLNHLRTKNDLVDTFRAIAALMESTSVFLFDMNHPDAYESVWGNADPYVSAGDDYRLELATTYRHKDRRAQAVVTGWAQVAGGSRIEIHEVRQQRAWAEREIIEALGAAGIVALDVLDFDPYNDEDPSAPGVKLVFVCRKSLSPGTIEI